MASEVRATYPLPAKLKRDISDIAALLQMNEKQLVAKMLAAKVSEMLAQSENLKSALKSMQELREHKHEGRPGNLASEE